MKEAGPEDPKTNKRAKMSAPQRDCVVATPTTSTALHFTFPHTLHTCHLLSDLISHDSSKGASKGADATNAASTIPCICISLIVSNPTRTAKARWEHAKAAKE